MRASFAKTRVLLLLSLSCIALVSILNLLAAMTRPTQAAPAATNVGGPITNTVFVASGQTDFTPVNNSLPTGRKQEVE